MSWLDIGASILDAGFSAWQANEKAKEDNYQAQQNRDFQERMSNTSYQRAVQDLNAAGLSPMLAYSKGGATTPGGSQAPGAAMASSDFAGGVQKSSARELNNAQIEAAKAQTEVNIATAKKVAEEAKLASMRVLQEPARFYYEQAESGSRINSNSAVATKQTVDARNNENLVTPTSDPYWWRDLKKGGKALFDKFLERNKSFPWSLEGRR